MHLFVRSLGGMCYNFKCMFHYLWFDWVISLLCICWQLVITDVNVAENDERVERAFNYITENFRAKDEMQNVTPASHTTKQQVTLSFAALFLDHKLIVFICCI